MAIRWSYLRKHFLLQSLLGIKSKFKKKRFESSFNITPSRPPENLLPMPPGRAVRRRRLSGRQPTRSCTWRAAYVVTCRGSAPSRADPLYSDSRNRKPQVLTDTLHAMGYLHTVHRKNKNWILGQPTPRVKTNMSRSHFETYFKMVKKLYKTHFGATCSKMSSKKCSGTLFYPWFTPASAVRSPRNASCWSAG